MFHCHNLIHEDHDMMAAFNVTALADFGYPETTHFVDPMEQRWRAKPEDPAKSTQTYIEGTLLPGFSALNAYSDAAGVEAALEAYWKGKGGLRKVRGVDPV